MINDQYINSSDSILSDEEHIVDQKIVRVWKFRNIWKFILLIIIVGGIPIPHVGPILFILSIWVGFYMVRERWKLTLTNQQIIARQLFPRPLTFFTNTHHFPLRQIEGMTVGPRAFNTLLLIGLFISTNLGVNLLKSGLSGDQRSDLPDILEALILILKGMTFYSALPKVGENIESFGLDIMDSIKTAQTFLGIFLIISGLIIVLITIPRRYHLQIRVKHGKDFRLSAGVKKSFWENCYREMYKTKFVEAPKEYKVWNFPWLENEKVETVTDIQRTIHLNRFIGILAIYIGILRIYNRLNQPGSFFHSDLIYWFMVALIDVFIAIVGVRYSSMRNEMVVTNRRIIFAEEIKNISGSIGKRVFHLSDISRDNVSGFQFKKLKMFSIIYLLLTITLIGSFLIFFDNLTLLPKTLFVLIIIISAFFINQTYIEFNLLTKGGEIWKMRHQLSNPATYLRELVGGDNKIMTTLFSNRLEESEIIRTVQIIRSRDINLKPNFVDVSKLKLTSLSLRINDLLLRDEDIIYQTGISRNVPRRKLTLTISTIIFVIWLSLIGVILDSELIDIDLGAFRPLIEASAAMIAIIALIALWVKYYSLFNAKLLLTRDRVFFQDVKDPPIWLYLLGMLSEEHVSEVLRDQVHSTYTSRQLNQTMFFRAFLRHFGKGFTYLIGWLILYGILQSDLAEDEMTNDYLNYLDILGPLLLGLAIIFGLLVAWNASNGYVELIRSRPRRAVNLKGVGFHFQFPFLNKEKSDQISGAIWAGKVKGKRES
ncbi:MAG: hypothetical protein HeimC2_38550 [Candidatus Heimdallarchaeota archaeon LC_2]|nr:MAG: hypothetical protein HeimC2_38550 [Candidatus Heimdallarchaeota archaeon LC_2]